MNQGCDPSAGEIAELALGSNHRRTFRDAVLQRLAGWVGCDSGWFHSVDPNEPLEAGGWVHMERGFVERARRGWAAYSTELLPLIQTAARDGVARDADVFARSVRDRLSFFREVAGPLRLRQSLWVILPMRGEIVSLGLSRGDVRKPFGDDAVRRLRSLVPVLAVSDHAAGASSRDPSSLLPILAPRERQVVDLVILGYRNREIAAALGTSVYTVRNQLGIVFRKLGATTRAELVGLVLGEQRPR